MARSALGDGEIMQRTVVGQDMRFKFSFDNGQVLQSDPIPPEKRKAGVIVAWCDAVRQMDANMQAEAELPRHVSELPMKEVPAPYAEAPTTPSAPARGDDPDSFILTSLEAAQRRYDAAAVEFATAEALLHKWERLAQALDEEAA